MMGLTAVQANALAYISCCIAENGVAPSFVEMREALGLASKEGVSRVLKALELRGAIRRLPNRARAIEIVHTGHSLRGFTDAALLAEIERRGLRL